MHASIVILDSRGERLFARGQVVLSSIIGLSPTNPAHLSAKVTCSPPCPTKPFSKHNKTQSSWLFLYIKV